MMRGLKQWLFDPEYQVVSSLYLYQRMYARGGMARWLAGFIGRWFVTGAGCHIAFNARIGSGLRLPHPVGIVISEECEIGDGVVIFQNVTLGRRKADVPGAPRLGNRVTLYAGAVVVGDITLGDGATIGANCVVDFDVPPGGVVTAPRGELSTPRDRLRLMR